MNKVLRLIVTDTSAKTGGLSGCLMNKVLRHWLIRVNPAHIGLSGYLINKVLKPLTPHAIFVPVILSVHVGLGGNER